MKSKLLLGILASSLAFGSVTAEAHSFHHYRLHAWRHLVRFAPRAIAQESSSLRELVARAAEQNGVPYSLANAVVTIESSYNPHAASGAGALGLMQIKAQTARGLGFRGSPASLFDPNVNLQYGMRYLALAYRQSGGNVCGTAMRYESGTAARYMSRENRAYCSRVSSVMGRV